MPRRRKPQTASGSVQPMASYGMNQATHSAPKLDSLAIPTLPIELWYRIIDMSSIQDVARTFRLVNQAFWDYSTFRLRKFIKENSSIFQVSILGQADVSLWGADEMSSTYSLIQPATRYVTTTPKDPFNDISGYMFEPAKYTEREIEREAYREGLEYEQAVEKGWSHIMALPIESHMAMSATISIRRSGPAIQMEKVFLSSTFVF